MKILLPSTASQLLKVIPREYSTAVDVVLTNEENNVSTTFSNLAANNNAGYLDIYDTWSESTPLLDDDYIEVTFTAQDDFDITTIEFDHSSFSALASRIYVNFHVYYQINSDGWNLIAEDIQCPAGYLTPDHLEIINTISLLTSDVFTLRIVTWNDQSAGGNSIVIDKNTFKISDVSGVVVDWVLDNAVNTSYDYFTFDNLKVSQPLQSYVGLSNNGIVTNNGGQWSGQAVGDGYTHVALLENDTFYSFKVLDYTTKDIIHRGRIFVTDQDVNKFTINNGQFIERGKDN